VCLLFRVRVGTETTAFHMHIHAPFWPAAAAAAPGGFRSGFRSGFGAWKSGFRSGFRSGAGASATAVTLGEAGAGIARARQVAGDRSVAPSPATSTFH